MDQSGSTNRARLDRDFAARAATTYMRVSNSPLEPRRRHQSEQIQIEGRRYFMVPSFVCVTCVTYFSEETAIRIILAS